MFDGKLFLATGFFFIFFAQYPLTWKILCRVCVYKSKHALYFRVIAADLHMRYIEKIDTHTAARNIYDTYTSPIYFHGKCDPKGYRYMYKNDTIALQYFNIYLQLAVEKNRKNVPCRFF